MPGIAIYITILVAFVILIINAVISFFILLANKSAANKRLSRTAWLAIPLFLPSICLIAMLHRWGMPIPKPKLPDRASGESVMFAVFAVIGAYLGAFGFLQLLKFLRR